MMTQATTARATAARSTSGTKRRRRTSAPLIQERRSPHTGTVYLYGDFRAYADVGGKVEPLCTPGERYATTEPDAAARLYADRVAHYKRLRANATNIAVSPRPDALQPSVTSANGTIDSAASSDASKPDARTSPEPKQLRLSEMIELHLQRKALPRSGRRASTVKRDRQNLAVVSRIVGDLYLDEITPQRCDDYVLVREQEPGVRPNTMVASRTIINELNSLGNMFKRAVAMGFVKENPVRRMAERPVAARIEAEFLTVEEAARLLDAAVELDDEARRAREASHLRRDAKARGDARRRGPARALRAAAKQLEGPDGLRHPNVARDYLELEAMIATFLYTGGRHAEVLGLRVADIDFDGKRIWFLPTPERNLKRDRHRREVPLWPPLELILRDYLRRTGIQEGLLFPGRAGKMFKGFAKAFRRCLERAGLAGGDRRLSPHALRHTYATMLLQTLVRTETGQLAVRSSFDVAKRLGHRSSDLVDDVYGHLVPNPQYSETLTYEGPRQYPATRLKRE